MIQKHQTSCCSLCQLTMSDADSREDIEAALKHLQKDAKREWDPTDRRGGERAAFVITTPLETALASRLEDLGFEPLKKFPRRNGYPKGDLTFWIKNW